MASDDLEGDDEISLHVHLTVTPETKREWMQYANEHYRGNLSSFSQTAANNTIDGDWVLVDEEESSG